MTAISAQDALRTRICAQPGCPNESRSDSDLCDEHRGRVAPENGYRRGVKGARKWTPEEVLEAVRRWTREKGKPPSSSDWQKSADVRGEYPSYTAATECSYEQGWGGGWRDLLARAGVLDAARAAAPNPTPVVPATSTPSEASPEGNDGGTGAGLVSLAQRVSELSELRRALLAELDALEVSLGPAIEDCAAALERERVEAA